MDWPHLLRFVGVTVAFSALVLLILVPRKVTRRLCSHCGHSNIVHDPVSGRCRSAVDAGVLVSRDRGAGLPTQPCRCQDYRGEL
ncbi:MULTISPECIES: hypothetical protein [Nocardia]|uniref:hypothetical protein n=1 Tax=Nocardia TaxID=1817 RepID=UPI00031005B4|nr:MULTISPECIES: hypothetical protein [Nocardia]